VTPAQIAHIMSLVDEYLYAPLKQKREAIEAALRDAPQAEGWVMVPVEVIAFLKGEEALEGKFFGEPDPFTKGRYWWRKYLREVTPSAPTAVEPDERTFSQWFDSLTTEDRYDFDSFGRGFKKDPTVMMRMAWDAARAPKGAP